MNILIIGNGFDLAHGLPTRYIDFLNFITIYKKLYNTDLKCIESDELFLSLHNDIKKYLISHDVSNISKHSKVLYEFDNLIRSNIWIEHIINKNNDTGKGWIDFEKEISDVIKALDNVKRNNEESLRKGKLVGSSDDKLYNYGAKLLNIWKNNKDIINDNNFMINEFYEEKAKEIIANITMELEKLIRCLEIYLEEFVGKIKLENKLKDIEWINEISPIEGVISFNYTNTYEKIYDIKKCVEYDYIHGKLDMSRGIKENNMVLGIDEYLDNEEQNINLDFIQFKKYFQRIYKKTGCEYKKWIENMKEIIYEDSFIECEGITDIILKPLKNNVYIFGHSLDITDKDIIKEIILANNVVTTIFYYDKEVYAKYITNLVKIIGQDELIKKVHGNEPTIIFRQQRK